MVGPKGKATSPPTVADGVVYYGDDIGNTQHAIDVVTGTELWNSGSAIAGPIFGAPIVANGMLYAVSWDHQLHAFGP
jgi:outer membrane protein assembly factor BamB